MYAAGLLASLRFLLSNHIFDMTNSKARSGAQGSGAVATLCFELQNPMRSLL